MARPIGGGGGVLSHILSGSISWFGGPNDPTSGPTTASGAPVTQPGIAVNNQATLGGWWAVKMPNGTIAVVQQTDIGPASWTGRTFDFLYSVLPALGYTQGNFPTGGNTQGIYLGKASNLGALFSQPTISSKFSSALASLGASTKQQVAFTSEIDAGALTHGAHVIAINSQGKAGSDVSTKLTGDATPTGIDLSGIANPLAALAKIAELLTSTDFWLRLGEAAAGIILLAMGLRSLTGNTTTPATVARAVTSRV